MFTLPLQLVQKTDIYQIQQKTNKKTCENLQSDFHMFSFDD